MPRSLAIRRNIAGVRKKVERRREREREKKTAPQWGLRPRVKESASSRAQSECEYTRVGRPRGCAKVYLSFRERICAELSLCCALRHWTHPFYLSLSLSSPAFSLSSRFISPSRSRFRLFPALSLSRSNSERVGQTERGEKKIAAQRRARASARESRIQ